MAKYEEKVSLEVAEEEFERFVEENGLLLDFDTMDEKDAADFTRHKQRMIREIQRGFLCIDEDGVAEFQPHEKQSEYKEKLVFYKRTGKHMANIRSNKSDNNAMNAYRMIASICKVSVDDILKLAGNDIKVCETIFIFLVG